MSALLPLARALTFGLTLGVELLLVLPLAYLALLSGAALLGAFGRRRAPGAAAAGQAVLPSSPSSRLPSFALLIPAHDEETTIGDLLASVRDLAYPASLRTACVVADNCTDGTAAIARAAGAAVYERTDPARRSKGHALGWLLEQLAGAGQRFDAYVIVDADSRLAPDFLEALAAALAGGAPVIQARYSVDNGRAGGAAGLRAVAFALFNHVRPLGRQRLGGSAGLKGNGMCFRADVLERLSWDASALAEDIQYHARLLCAGIHVAYVPAAQVTSAMPTGLRQARSQQARWERGRLELARACVPVLLAGYARTCDAALLDAALEIATPPLSALVAAVGACLAAAVVLAWPPALWLAGALAAALALHLLTGVCLARLPARAWLSLAGAPVFVAWKCWVYLVALVGRGERRWVRTARPAGAGREADTSGAHGA